MKYIKAIVESRICKFNNRFGINFLDSDSVILKPIKIGGGSNIYIGRKTYIGEFSWIEALENYRSKSFIPKIVFGDFVNIGRYSCITAINTIEICDNVLISEYFYVSDHFHDIKPNLNVSPIEMPLSSKGKVKIGKNTFIGYRVSILSGVTIGEYCVVGANSVVLKSFPSYTMIAGVPAKIIKIFSFETNDWIDYKPLP
ncbi:acyltransferase [Algoriphagus sp. NBT04N3]|uniref:acyltransferase n=1 Tax=Algoriphagus sp. NBT04N3 TaxID=2705473 RepID=UPI002104A378|nr:acyltransferase [Algoriphagus sp. NBT04N3]QYH38002.1 acyltransferase [Algoriphagus sp. NBT04N3]